MGRLAARIIGVATAVILIFAISAPVDAATDSPPVSYTLIDNDTGKVLSDGNSHVDLPPASITKLLTALVVVRDVPSDKSITISRDSARMPAMKINAREGEQWKRDDLLHALLMVSANDAAVALAEAAGGSLQGFAEERAEAARQLGLTDNPVFRDPAGLDDATFSNEGGDLVSAHDMAIVARAAFADPLIRSIVAKQKYEFVGPDGVHHVLTNHNRMLWTYQGSVGMKTGYTHKAGYTYVGAATREGRTMLVVLMGAPSQYGNAAALLDSGFATPVNAESANSALLPTASLKDAPKSVVASPKTTSQLGQRNVMLAMELAVGFLVLVIFAAGLRSGVAYLRRSALLQD